MNYPEILYKYRKVDIFAEEIICHNSIYLSSPLHFNDPFDSSSDLIAFPKEKEAKVIYDKLDHSNKKTISEIFSPQDNGYNYYVHLIAMGHEIDTKLSRIGICCFSGINNNILSWSHYADNHKGVCIQFKPNYDKYPFNLINRVHYSEDKPKVDYPPPELGEILRTKYKDWQYEDEFRVIDQNRVNTTVILDPSEIVGVIMGYRISEIDTGRIIHWARRSKSKISIYKAKKAFSKYSLEVEYYKDPELQFRDDLYKALIANAG